MSPNPNSAAGSIRSQPCFYPHYIEYIPLFSLGYALGLLCSFTQPISRVVAVVVSIPDAEKRQPALFAHDEARVRSLARHRGIAHTISALSLSPLAAFLDIATTLSHDIHPIWFVRDTVKSAL